MAIVSFGNYGEIIRQKFMLHYSTKKWHDTKILVSVTQHGNWSVEINIVLLNGLCSTDFPSRSLNVIQEKVT